MNNLKKIFARSLLIILFFISLTAPKMDVISQGGNDLPGGLSMAKEIFKPTTSSRIFSGPHPVGSRVFFFLLNPIEGIDFWVSDGSEVGTVFLRNFIPLRQGIDWYQNILFSNLNEVAFFLFINPQGQAELWKSDGAPGGTLLLHTFPGASSVAGSQRMVAVDGKLYFSLYGGSGQLWRTDGTQQGTQLVAQAYTQGNMVEFNHQLYFVKYSSGGANDPAFPLYRTSPDLPNGSPGPVELVVENFQGIYISDNLLTVLGDKLFFAAQDETHGMELWTYSPLDGANLVRDIFPGSAGSSLRNFVVHDQKLYFTAIDTPAPSWQLWQSDGSLDGTVKVVDLNMTSVNGITSFQDMLILCGQTAGVARKSGQD